MKQNFCKAVAGAWMVTVSTLGLTGCATMKPAAYDSSKSEALNVMEAAFPDGIASRFLNDSDREAPTTSADAALNGAAAGGIAHAARKLPGSIVSATDVGVAALSSALASNPDARLRPAMVIAWAPYATDDDKKALHAYLDQVYAALKAVSEAHGKPATRKVETEQPLNPYRVEGFSKQCKPIVSKVDGSLVELPVIAISSDDPEQRPAPEWLGGNNAWFFQGAVSFGTHCLKNESLRLLRELSEKLPEWMYVYSGLYSQDDPANPKPITPLVFHQGKVLKFVKP